MIISHINGCNWNWVNTVKVTENNQDEVQRRLWSVELEILDEIHRVCTENGLRYSLAYGTLLGAVRHQGFIPWDDDVDIMMPREDYDRLIEIWGKKAAEAFLLETPEMYPDSVNNFAKIRKDHTTFLQFESERTKSRHKGIFVDVFPADRRAKGWLPGKLQYADFALALLFNRGYTSGAGGVVGLTERALLHIIPRKQYRKLSCWAERRGRRWNEDDSAQLVLPSSIRDCRLYYPPDLFDHLEQITFEEKNYDAVRDKDRFLTICYGDYMQLPPEEERIWKHHPILIDFEHNYEELETEA